MDQTNVASDTLAFISNIGKANETGIFIPSYHLVAGKSITVTLTVDTPFLSKTSTSANYPIISTPGRELCGPCQLKDRTRCIQFNGICWTDYLDSTVSLPTLDTKCLKAMAPDCYKLWKSQGGPSKECVDFNSYYNYTLMSTKPSVNETHYSIDGQFIVVTFNTPINNDTFIECSEFLADESLNWLPVSRSGIWINKYTLNIAYDPQIGTMPKISFKDNAIFYNYIYAQEPMSATTLPISMPEANVQLSIKSPSVVSECDTLTLNVVNQNETIYVLNFRWSIKFSNTSSLMSKADIEDANFFFQQFTQVSRSRLAVIPNKYLYRGSIISVNVDAMIEGDTKVLNSSSMNIKVADYFPKIKFTSKNQQVLQIESDDTEVIAIQTDNTKCQKSKASSSGSAIQAEIKFKVYSAIDQKTVMSSGTYEPDLSTKMISMFSENKQLVLSYDQGFDFYTYYLLVAEMRDSDTGNTVNDTLILQFVKPWLESIANTEGSLLSVNNNVQLFGDRSSFPEADSKSQASQDNGKLRATISTPDVVNYRWKCIKATDLTSLTKCACPVIDDGSASKSRLIIAKEKFTSLCSYTFGLAIAAKGNKFTRTAYNETEFIMYQGPTIQLRGKLIKGSQQNGKDIYLTFEMNTTDSVGNIQYEWKLIEMKSQNPRQFTQFSHKKSYIAGFFKSISNADITLDLSDEKEIPTSELPKFITPLNRRIIGFDKDSLRSNYEYLFAVKAYFSKTPTFLYVKLTTPPAPRRRIVTVSPSSGIGLITQFEITYSLETSNELDQADYQIFRRDCPSEKDSVVVPITRTLATSNSFSTTLSPGHKKCNYQVEIIVRVTENDDFIDNSYAGVTITEDDSPKDQLMANVVDMVMSSDRTSTIDEKLSILTSLTDIQIVEQSTIATIVVEKILNFTDTIDSNSSGIMTVLNDDNKVQLLNATANIMSNLINNNAPNVNMNVTNKIKDKVGTYLEQVKDKVSGANILSACLNTLSGVANAGTDRKQNNTFFESMQGTLTAMANMKLGDLQPGAPSYNLTSEAIEMSTKKNYVDEFNSTQNFSSSNGTMASLPPGIGDSIITEITNSTSITESTITVGVSLVATEYNPYPDIKSNTEISVDSLGNSTSEIVSPDVIGQIYADISKGKLGDVVNPGEMGTNIMQLSLNPYQLSKDSSESKLNKSVSIQQVTSGKSMEFSLPSKDPAIVYGNDTLVVPMYYVPENGTWSNKGCKVSTPNMTSTTLKANCTSPSKKQITSVSEAHSFAIDVVKDILSILLKGNYASLYNFSAFKKVTSTNIVIYCVVGAIIGVFIFTEICLYNSDLTVLFDARIKILIMRYDPSYKEPSRGILFSALSALSTVRKKGFLEAAKEKKKEQPKNTPPEGVEEPSSPTTTIETIKAPVLPPLPNGFSCLHPGEEKSLKELYLLHDELQNKIQYPPEIVMEMIYELIMEERILARITQAALDDEVIKDEIRFCMLLRNYHPFVNALAKPDLTTPRMIKLFIVVSTVVGQLFVTGFFFNANDEEEFTSANTEMIEKTALYSIAGALLMVPLKIIISVFLVGKKLTETMTRQEIEKAEDRGPFFKKIGFVVGNCWLLGCLYGILMFAISFSEEALWKWLITFATSICSDLLILQNLKIFTTVLCGMILLKLAQTQIMNTIAGVIADYIVSFAFNYF